MKRRVKFAVALLVAMTSTAWAGPGVAELTLDRVAVRDLVALALGEPLSLELPGLGTVTARFEAPTRVRFHDRGVEALLPVRLDPTGRVVELAVRYVPAIEPLSGTVRLEAESVVPAIPFPVELDLAAWVGSVDLPRRLDWDLELAGGRSARVSCFVQGLAVEDDRLRIELGLVSK